MLLGTNKLDRVTERLDKKFLHLFVEQLHSDMGEFVREVTTKTMNNLDIKTIERVILANDKLTESQKAAIANIIAQPKEPDNIYA
jgi:uncharacterized protein YprB with RNaseH-like and TPR domain